MKFNQFEEFKSLTEKSPPPKYAVQFGPGDVPRFVRRGAAYRGVSGRRWCALWEVIDVEIRVESGKGLFSGPDPQLVSVKLRQDNSLRIEQFVFYENNGVWMDMCERPSVFFADGVEGAARRFGSFTGSDFGGAEKAEAWFDLQFACMGLAADPDPGT